jgi:hypothetical protein
MVMSRPTQQGRVPGLRDDTGTAAVPLMIGESDTSARSIRLDLRAGVSLLAILREPAHYDLEI